MNNFKIIYKILKLLEKNMGNEDFEINCISPKAFNISFNRWEQLLIKMQDEEYIKGIKTDKSKEDKYEHIVEPIFPQITIKGMEYLRENNMMKKVESEIIENKENEYLPIDETISLQEIIKKLENMGINISKAHPK